jgi:predicted dehydrogenase
MTEAVAVGIAGCGRVVERGYLPAIAGTTQLRLVGVADPDAGRRARIAPGVPGFETVAELLSSVPLDVLVVATPPAVHERVAVSAATAGVRSIVEKPPAGNAEGAAALAALDPPPWIGFNRRFEPEVERLRDDGLEASREIEVVLSIDARRWQAFEGSPGPLLDLGPHAVDVVCWATGLPPRRVRCQPGRRRYLSFVLELDGALAHLHLSHEAGWHELVRLGGATYLRRGGRGDRARRAAMRRPGPLVASLRAELEAAGRVLRGETQVDARLGSAAEGVLVMETLDAMALAALEPGTWVSVDERMASCSP